jgi:hypothetical protein
VLSEEPELCVDLLLWELLLLPKELRLLLLLLVKQLHVHLQLLDQLRLLELLLLLVQLLRLHQWLHLPHEAPLLPHHVQPKLLVLLLK